MQILSRLNDDAALFAGPPELSSMAVEIHECEDCKEQTAGRIDSPPNVCFYCGSDNLRHQFSCEPDDEACPVYLLGNREAAA